MKFLLMAGWKAERSFKLNPNYRDKKEQDGVLLFMNKLQISLRATCAFQTGRLAKRKKEVSRSPKRLSEFQSKPVNLPFLGGGGIKLCLIWDLTVQEIARRVGTAILVLLQADMHEQMCGASCCLMVRVFGVDLLHLSQQGRKVWESQRQLLCSVFLTRFDSILKQEELQVQPQARKTANSAHWILIRGVLPNGSSALSIEPNKAQEVEMTSYFRLVFINAFNSTMLQRPKADLYFCVDLT